MSLAYEVTRRGAGGEPVQISCRAHPGCTWSLATSGPRRDDDAILRAMMQAHVDELITPDRPASGHERRKRR